MTRSQFAQKVMARLGIWDKGSLGPDDQTTILDAYDSIYLILKDDGLVTWAQPATIEDEDIPERFQLNLSAIVAAEIAGDFNLDEKTIGRLFAQAVLAKKRHVRQLQSGQDTDPTEAEYF